MSNLEINLSYLVDKIARHDSKPEQAGKTNFYSTIIIRQRRLHGYD